MRFAKNFSSSQLELLTFSLLILFLPTQLGRHFWPDFSIINGIRVDYLSPTFYFTDALISILFFLRLPYLLRFRFKQPQIVFGLLAIFLGITVLTSAHPFNGLYSFIKFLELAFLCYYVKTAVSTVISLEKLTGLLAFGVIGESLLGIVQFIQQSSIGGLLYFLGERSFTASTPGIANASLNGELVMRAYGTFSHPNVFAGYLLISMILVFFILFPANKTSLKLLAAAALLLGTIGIVLTLSRVAILLWVGFIIAVFLWQISKKRFRKIKLHASIGLVGLFIIGITFSQILLPRFLQTALTEESVTQRQQLIDASMQLITYNPLTGVGPGNFLHILSQIQSPLSLAQYLQPVHNIFLLIAAETGLIGLGIFLWFLGNSYRYRIASLKGHTSFARSSMAVLICLSMMLIIGLFDHYWLTVQQGQLLFSLILGLMWI